MGERRLKTGRLGRRAEKSAVDCLPSYVPFEDWRAAFVDGRQLARIIFAEMESLFGVSRFMWCRE